MLSSRIAGHGQRQVPPAVHPILHGLMQQEADNRITLLGIFLRHMFLDCGGGGGGGGAGAGYHCRAVGLRQARQHVSARLDECLMNEWVDPLELPMPAALSARVQVVEHCEQTEGHRAVQLVCQGVSVLCDIILLKGLNRGSEETSVTLHLSRGVLAGREQSSQSFCERKKGRSQL